MPDEYGPEMDTAPLFDKIEALHKRLEGQERALNQKMTDDEEQSRERHRFNGALSSTLDKIESTVGRIETCLLGDPQYQRVGLIAEVQANQKSTTILEKKLDVELSALEKKISDVDNALKFRTKAAGLVISVLGMAGLVIAWLKSTGFAQFLGKTP